MPETERTEPATPHRRSEARARGQVAKSIEVNTAFVLLTGFLALRYFSGYIFKNLESTMRFCLSNLAKVDLDTFVVLPQARGFIFQFLLMSLPLALTVAIAVIAANLFQVGFLHSWQVIQPQLSRINPMAGLKKFFSYRAILELVKSLLKIIFTAAVVYLNIKGELKHLILTVDTSPLESVNLVSFLVFRMGLRIGLVLAALAVADYLYQRWEHERSLRMTRQELKEELIRYEGRPETRQRIRLLQRQSSVRRMMQEVPKAEVVITNPAHLAVALQYKPQEMVAPRVVAKGARLIAQKIIEVAREHQVPIIENKPLARMLFKMVGIGQVIPLALYQVVADVLAYLWRVGKTKKRWF